MARNFFNGKTTPSTSVTVYWVGTTVKPTIYVSATGASASNPVTSAADGSYGFWVDDGHYKIVNGRLNSTGAAADITSEYITTAAVAFPTAKDISLIPFLSRTETDLETYLQNLLRTPSLYGPLTVADTTASTSSTTGSGIFGGGLGIGGNSFVLGDLALVTANGAKVTFGSLSENLTLSTSGTTTDTTANLLPANSLILGVTARITTTITTATDWKLGDATTAGRFTAANSTLVSGTTDVGLLHLAGGISTDATGPVQVAAAKLRVTTTGTPGAGRIRLTTFFLTFTAPTS